MNSLEALRRVARGRRLSDKLLTELAHDGYITVDTTEDGARRISLTPAGSAALVEVDQ